MITVKSEMIVPASGKPTADNRGHYYLDPDGLRRRETRNYQSQADTTDFKEYRDSPDNGRTWGEWVREPKPSKEPVGNDEIDENQNYPNAQHVWNPVHRHHVSLECQFIYVNGFKETERKYYEGETRPMHSFLKVETEDGVTYPRQQLKYEAGADYDRSNYHETDYLCTNNSRGSELIVLKDGDILFNLQIPVNVACRLVGLDRNVVFPSAWGNGHAWALMICRGKWNAETKLYDVTYNPPIVMDDRQSINGISEPMFAELTSGRIFVIFRVYTIPWPNDPTCRISPYAPSLKYYMLSDDNGKTFSPPMPWHFDSREILYSSATFSRLIRSGKNGKLYWIGNIIDPTKGNGLWPRYPLCIVEVDETWGVAKKDTVTVIDTRREGETEKVELSNFVVLDNRETGDLEIYLSKYRQYPDHHMFDCETWKYTVTLPE